MLARVAKYVTEKERIPKLFQRGAGRPCRKYSTRRRAG